MRSIDPQQRSLPATQGGDAASRKVMNNLCKRASPPPPNTFRFTESDRRIPNTLNDGVTDENVHCSDGEADGVDEVDEVAKAAFTRNMYMMDR